MILDIFQIWADLSHLVSFQKYAPGEVRMALERNVAATSMQLRVNWGLELICQSCRSTRDLSLNELRQLCAAIIAEYLRLLQAGGCHPRKELGKNAANISWKSI